MRFAPYASCDADRPVVLYVDDEPMNVVLMQALFQRRPQLELAVARSGAEALERADALEPALLMLDLRLPDCHGADLLTLLRAQPGWAEVPAVAVTAEADVSLADTDFDDIWLKPLDVVFVLRQLDQMLLSQIDMLIPAARRAYPLAATLGA